MAYAELCINNGAKFYVKLSNHRFIVEIEMMIKYIT